MGSLKTYYEKKGDEKAWIYFLTSDKQEYCFYLEFYKDIEKPLTRVFQDELINGMIMTNLHEFINNNYKFSAQTSSEFKTIKVASEDIAAIHSNPRE